MIIEKKCINIIRDFDAIRDAWLELETGKEMTIYQAFKWNQLLAEEQFNTFVFGLFTSIVVYIVKDTNETKLILPLIIQKRNNKTKWFGRKRGIYILGHGSYSDYLNAIYKNITDSDLKDLFNKIHQDYPKYEYTFTDLIQGTTFERFVSGLGLEELESTVSVAVEKADSIREYTKMLSKHVRQNLRTSLNRMKKDQLDYEYKVVEGVITDDEVLNKLRELHVERMIEKNNVDTDLIHKLSSAIRISYRAHKENNNNIIYESMRTMEKSVFVLVFLNGELSGYLYGLKETHTIRIMQNCFKSKYKFYSPMFRGAYDFLIDCYENPEIERVDFTRGNEPYKYQLAGVETILKQYSGKLQQ